MQSVLALPEITLAQVCDAIGELCAERRGLCTIRLHGELGERYGKVWHLAVRSVGEALRAIEAQAKGFLQFVRDFGGIGFEVVRNGLTIPAPEGDDQFPTVQELQMCGLRSVSIIPVPSGAGSGKGIIQAIIGAVLVVASFYIGGSAGIAYFGAVASQAISQVALSIGIGLTLSGLSSLLATSPNSTPDTKADNKASYIFQNAANVSAQGGPVQVVYGRMIIGSTVVSAGIASRDIGTPRTPGTGTPGATMPLPPNAHNDP